MGGREKRLTGTIVMQRPGQPACQLRQVCPPVGHAHFYGRVKLFTEGEETAYLALACPEEAADDPWYVASDEPTDSQTLPLSVLAVAWSWWRFLII
jgi:hypothetical protein